MRLWVVEDFSPARTKGAVGREVLGAFWFEILRESRGLVISSFAGSEWAAGPYLTCMDSRYRLKLLILSILS